MVRKIERGARIPRPEFLERADEILNVYGHLKAFMEDIEKARYPKKVRELKALEDRAVEVMQYSNHNIQGLLQTPEYARVLFETRQPAYSPDVVERETAAHTARNSIFEREPAPTVSRVLLRPAGDAPPQGSHSGLNRSRSSNFSVRLQRATSAAPRLHRA
jgi:Domain of unknown function (DUF5753)